VSLPLLPACGKDNYPVPTSPHRKSDLSGLRPRPLGCRDFRQPPIYSEVINPCLLLPPPPRFIGIIGLGGNSRQVFEFKGLIGKVFRNKDLGCQRALKMGLGQLRGPSWETGAPLNCPNQMAIVALRGLEVCDGGHWLVVMKKGQRHGPSEGLDMLPLQVSATVLNQCLPVRERNLISQCCGVLSVIAC